VFGPKPEAELSQGSKALSNEDAPPTGPSQDGQRSGSARVTSMPPTTSLIRL